MTLSTHRRIFATATVAVLALLAVWWRSRSGGGYQAGAISDGAERWGLSLGLVAYMGGAVAFDLRVVLRGGDLARDNSASYSLWLFGKSQTVFIWLNGCLTVLACFCAFRPVWAATLIFQIHLWFGIQGLPAPTPEPT